MAGTLEADTSLAATVVATEAAADTPAIMAAEDLCK
jgi:hypothetical protein